MNGKLMIIVLNPSCNWASPLKCRGLLDYIIDKSHVNLSNSYYKPICRIGRVVVHLYIKCSICEKAQVCLWMNKWFLMIKVHFTLLIFVRSKSLTLF